MGKWLTIKGRKSKNERARRPLPFAADEMLWREKEEAPGGKPDEGGVCPWCQVQLLVQEMKLKICTEPFSRPQLEGAPYFCCFFAPFLLTIF